MYDRMARIVLYLITSMLFRTMPFLFSKNTNKHIDSWLINL